MRDTKLKVVHLKVRFKSIIIFSSNGYKRNFRFIIWKFYGINYIEKFNKGNNNKFLTKIRKLSFY